MYTIEELYKLDSNPRINQITLVLLLEYYDKFLTSYTYKIFIKNHSEDCKIISFPLECFCHLLSIENIVGKSVNRRDLYNYKGVAGANNIANGLITFDSLKKMNKSKFKSVKEKFVFFYLIPKLFTSGKAVYFNKENVQGSAVNSDIIFYDNFIDAFVHIGLVNNECGIYVPRTFLIEKVTPDNDGLKFIENQEVLEIEGIEIDSADSSQQESAATRESINN